MKRLQFLAALALSFFMLTSFDAKEAVTAVADDYGRWVVLGKRTINMRADHDELRVTAARGTFKRLKFKVKDAPIYVRNVKVVYGNGSSENHLVNKHFRKGRSSRVLDLKGGNRVIKKIVFNYRTINVGKGKAHIIAYGKH